MKAITTSRRDSKGCLFRLRPQPVGEGNEQNYPKEAHFLIWVERGRSL